MTLIYNALFQRQLTKVTFKVKFNATITPRGVFLRTNLSEVLEVGGRRTTIPIRANVSIS